MALSGRLVLLLAVACGATVANLYYAQPLLDTIARELHVSSGTAGLLVTATQLGYVGGLLLIVPLGDLLQRRKLVVAAALARRVRLGRRVGRAVLRRARHRAGVRRRLELRDADPDPVRVQPGARGGARARRRAGDDRRAAGHPARAHGLRLHRGARRLAVDLRAGRGAHAAVRGRAATGAAGGQAAVGHALPAAAGVGRRARPRGAGAALADAARARSRWRPSPGCGSRSRCCWRASTASARRRSACSRSRGWRARGSRRSPGARRTAGTVSARCAWRRRSCWSAGGCSR